MQNILSNNPLYFLVGINDYELTPSTLVALLDHKIKDYYTILSLLLHQFHLDVYKVSSTTENYLLIRGFNQALIDDFRNLFKELHLNKLIDVRKLDPMTCLCTKKEAEELTNILENLILLEKEALYKRSNSFVATILKIVLDYMSLYNSSIALKIYSATIISFKSFIEKIALFNALLKEINPQKKYILLTNISFKVVEKTIKGNEDIEFKEEYDEYLKLYDKPLSYIEFKRICLSNPSFLVFNKETSFSKSINILLKELKYKESSKILNLYEVANRLSHSNLNSFNIIKSLSIKDYLTITDFVKISSQNLLLKINDVEKDILLSALLITAKSYISDFFNKIEEILKKNEKTFENEFLL